jgi:hypothetical protein
MECRAPANQPAPCVFSGLFGVRRCGKVALQRGRFQGSIRPREV